LFGHVINFLFNIVYSIGPAHSLGITIIIMTIIFRALMMPMSIKAQKSMMKMREIKPELDKIQAKYGKTKDPEKLRKMNAERSALMAKHDANPIKGCFPLLLQMPLFIGLNFIMRQAFMYIGRLRDLYYEISEVIISYPNYLNVIAPTMPLPQAQALPAEVANASRLIPDRMQENAAEAFRLHEAGIPYEQLREHAGDFINLGSAADLSRIIHRFTPDNWQWLSTQIPATYWNAIETLNQQRDAIEIFFGISMIEASEMSLRGILDGLRWPNILIPLLVGITMFMSSWVMQLRTNDPNADERIKLQMRMMLVIMPIMMMGITFGLPAGVGLFWITSQVYQIAQDLVLNKRAGIPFVLPFAKKEEQ